MKNNAFLIACRNVGTTATLYLADLTPIGLVQADLDNLSAEAQIFEDKLNAIAEKKKLRDAKSKERIDLANSLYDEVVKYCKIGKLVFENVNEAYYNDYIIYKTTHHGLSEPQNPTAVVDSCDPTHAIVSCDSVQDANLYKLYYSEVALGSPEGDFTFILENATPNFDYQMTLGKRTYWKIRAFNDTQSSDYSDSVYLGA